MIDLYALDLSEIRTSFSHFGTVTVFRTFRCARVMAKTTHNYVANFMCLPLFFLIPFTAEKMQISIKDFFSKEILNGKVLFCAVLPIKVLNCIKPFPAANILLKNFLNRETMNNIRNQFLPKKKVNFKICSVIYSIFTEMFPLLLRLDAVVFN